MCIEFNLWCSQHAEMHLVATPLFQKWPPSQSDFYRNQTINVIITVDRGICSTPKHILSKTQIVIRFLHFNQILNTLIL